MEKISYILTRDISNTSLVDRFPIINNNWKENLIRINNFANVIDNSIIPLDPLFKISPQEQGTVSEFIIQLLEGQLCQRDERIGQLETDLAVARHDIEERDEKLARFANAEQLVLNAQQKAQDAEDEAGRQKFRAESAERKATLIEQRSTESERRFDEERKRLQAENSQLRDENRRLKATRTSAGIPTPTSPSPFKDLGIDPTIFTGKTKDQAFKIIESMRRVMAQMEHPDVGGNTETMKKVNVAADTLRSWCERNLS